MKKSLFLTLLFLYLNSVNAQYQPIVFGSEINGPGGGYPRMAEYSNGNLLMGVDTGNGIEIHESSDNGNTWSFKSTAVPSAGLPTNYHVGNVFLHRISDLEWLCAYRYVNDHDNFTPANEDDGINEYYLRVTKSVDGGNSWSFLSEIVHTGSPIANAGANPGGVWEPFLFNIPQTGELLVFYAKEDARPGPGDTQKIICKRSYDNGASWTSEIIVAEGINSRDGMPEVILTPNNQLICVFEAQDNVNNNAFGIKIKRSDDFGFTWHSRTVVHNASFSGQYGAGAPYIAQLKDGRILISYQEQNGTNNPTKYGYIVSENDGQTWSTEQYLFVADGWWNGMYVDNNGTLFMNTSGTKILKANFSSSQAPLFYFKIEAQHSGKVIATATSSSPPNGDVIEQQTFTNSDNQLWMINDGGNGYFYLSPKNAPNMTVQVKNSDLLNGASIELSAFSGANNQLWYVTESPNGYYQITNKLSGKVLDVKQQQITDNTPIVQWNNYVSSNQKMKAIATNGAVYDPLKPYIKWGYIKIINKNSGKSLDVSGFDFNLGANIQQWDYLNAINQQWLLHDADSGYVWLEPRIALGKCIEVAAWGTTNGSNIILWEFLGNDNQLWKPEITSPGYVKFTNKNSGLVLDVTNASQTNGENIHSWQWLAANNQQWGFQYINNSDNPLVPFLNYGNYSCQNSLIPGSIGNSQTLLCALEDPLAFTSLSTATGNNPITYQWQYSLDNTTWIDLVNETNTTYDSPVLQGLVTPPFTAYARRMVTDVCSLDSSNVVSIDVTQQPLSPGAISGNQSLCETDDPAAFVSNNNGTGEGVILYQWQYSLDNINWLDLVNETNTTYNSPVLQGLATTPFTAYARRLIADDCTSDTSNVVSIQVNICTGINKTNKDAKISIYPVPTKDQLTISSSELIKEINIYDTKGALVISQKTKLLITQINVSELERGLYFIQVQTKAKNHMLKFIK